MIQVNKRKHVPAVLRKRGAKATRRMAADYDADPKSFRNGSRKFDFDSSVYAAKSVKNALIKDQHHKCGFCEAKITHVAYGDVEHFRPKAGHKQKANDNLGRPGYYWLAYDWDNLLLSCQICNQRHKGNLFPLLNPSKRAISHHDRVDREQPAFIQPAVDLPGDHIGFRDEYAHPHYGSKRGRITIDGLGLNREALVEQRRDHLQRITPLVSSRDALKRKFGVPAAGEIEELLQKIDTQLAQEMTGATEFSAMNRAFLAGH